MTMKNITLGILILFCMIHALTANKKETQRRVRREQATRKFLLYLYLVDGKVQLARSSKIVS